LRAKVQEVLTSLNEQNWTNTIRITKSHNACWRMELHVKVD
jgi:hypothetical protein